VDLSGPDPRIYSDISALPQSHSCMKKYFNIASLLELNALKCQIHVNNQNTRITTGKENEYA